ncbi:MAG: winged helix-turn-helix transcriptional regulator [Flavobacteriales bacterium]|nr:winged helix-turn-helix transcriptional regulator [Flavobacteriales bacterium]
MVESQQKIVRLVVENPKISKKEMSEQIGISTTAIDKNINTLKDKKIIRRVSDKGGYWEVLT